MQIYRELCCLGLEVCDEVAAYTVHAGRGKQRLIAKLTATASSKGTLPFHHHMPAASHALTISLPLGGDTPSCPVHQFHRCSRAGGFGSRGEATESRTESLFSLSLLLWRPALARLRRALGSLNRGSQDRDLTLRCGAHYLELLFI